MVVTAAASGPAQHRRITRKKKFRLARRLWRLGDRVGALRWLAASLTGSWKPVRVNIRGHRIMLRASSNDLAIALETLCGEFDELFDKVPTIKHGLIIDAGGYLGTAAISFAETYPQAMVVTLEPGPENFALLSKNTAPYPNILTLNKALDRDSGVIELRDRGLGFAGLTTIDRPDDNPGSEVVATVERVTVSQLLDEFGFSGIDIFKIDIEGGERQLLSGNLSWISNTRAVCIELHDRIASGCSEAWQGATAGRRNSKLQGEKYLSMAVEA
jgi:FkbM family methyltransferase